MTIIDKHEITAAVVNDSNLLLRPADALLFLGHPSIDRLISELACGIVIAPVSLTYQFAYTHPRPPIHPSIHPSIHRCCCWWQSLFGKIYLSIKQWMVGWVWQIDRSGRNRRCVVGCRCCCRCRMALFCRCCCLWRLFLFIGCKGKPCQPPRQQLQQQQQQQPEQQQQ